MESRGFRAFKASRAAAFVRRRFVNRYAKIFQLRERERGKESVSWRALFFHAGMSLLFCEFGERATL